jgi:hypothetical protein
MGYAALRALLREARGRSDWEKTHHAGNHLAPTSIAGTAA